MDRGKKHVIPRHQYKRKRREFFHNEDREARVEREKAEKEREREREAQLAKNNEARVKDNMRKARIEKLTQEEIQHQQARTSSQYEVKQPDKEEGTSSHQDKVETTNEYKETPQDKEEPIKGQDSGEDIQLKSSSKQHEKRDPYSLNNKHKESATEDENSVKEDKESIIPNPKLTGASTDKEDAQSSNHNSEKRNSTTDDSDDSSNFYSEKAQQSRVDKYVSDDDKHPADYHDEYKDSAAHHNKQAHQSNDYFERFRSFMTHHWSKLLIALGIILLIILIVAIFNNVNNNGKGSNHLFNSNNNNDDKHYTDTMKSANKTIHSVVTVENDTKNDRSSIDKETEESGKDNELGSGVVYKKVDGAIYVMTNAHVVGDKKKQKITYDNNETTTGTVIGSDKWSDIAIVKANIKKNSSVKPIEIGDSSNLTLGEPIIVVGNPLGVDFKGSVTEGIISGLNRHVPVDIDKDGEYDELINAIQIDAPVNPGNSGGAVVNREGKLIGVASLKIDMDKVEGIAFALPVNDAQTIAKELEQKGEVKYPNTGIRIANLADLSDGERSALQLPSDVKKGIVVGDIKPGSLGDKSGLRKNDVIVKLDDKDIEDKLRYRQILFSHKDDKETLPAKVYRNGKIKDIDIKLK
ncbi:S1C family serine protease [Staphylococcus sp. SQ8-PEA]|uniref:Serine protease HtrA-like n=1 Tax=Staphylococcus marylandisciuri TaxID=2981529 RepID=A0ABT2QPV7_9STAP|nr:S1C family serine protease [Staphylococcus marylandisciuri]MCU5746011.1 S1C family serine protease [Staphylococcus marylandisciuri]